MVIVSANMYKSIVMWYGVGEEGGDKCTNNFVMFVGVKGVNMFICTTWKEM